MNPRAPDPPVEAALAGRVKKALRARMAQLRKAMPAAARAERSQRIVDQLVNHPWFQAAQGVALFAPILAVGEVDVRSIDAQCRATNKRVYYPFMDPTPSGIRTGFRQVGEPGELVRRGRNFLEPDPAIPDAAAADIDFIVVPALAAATTGHRIGSGSGFYDATLPDFPDAKTCVVIFSFQLLAEVPIEPHDRPCHLVCSDAELFEGTA